MAEPLTEEERELVREVCAELLTIAEPGLDAAFSESELKLLARHIAAQAERLSELEALEERAARTARIRRYLAWPVLGLLLALVAWTLLVATPVTGATVFTPPTSYRAWWAEVEQCSGRRGDYDAVTWASVPSPTVNEHGGPFAKALYKASNNTIVLARPYLDDARIVRHEMLHALLYPTDGHPRELFVVRCGALVELSE